MREILVLNFLEEEASLLFLVHAELALLVVEREQGLLIVGQLLKQAAVRLGLLLEAVEGVLPLEQFRFIYSYSAGETLTEAYLLDFHLLVVVQLLVGLHQLRDDLVSLHVAKHLYSG